MSLRVGAKRVFTRRVLAVTAAVLLTGGGVVYWKRKNTKSRLQHFVKTSDLVAPVSITREQVNLPTRDQLLSKLAANKFDILIIGGGATGTGCAVDAATRGLDVALVEKNDFASGTSSKSTKMAHGGVRYLEKAFMELSKEQLDLVIEALNERAHLLNTAPHLCKVLPIMIPVYKYWQLPYFYAGCKFYDFFAGSQNLRSSYVLSKTSACELAPMLDATKLKAGLVYHDGLFNDSRMNTSLAVTAIEKGATVLNYVEVEQLLKDKTTGKLNGAIVKDNETGKTYQVNAKVIVNATGPFSDRILEMDKNEDGLPDKNSYNLANKDITAQIAVTHPKMVVPSTGVHIILPSYYCPKDVGLLDAKTSDGRVMFFLPWQGKVLAGTTDIPLKQVPENLTASEADIEDILKELQHYIRYPVRREDVLSAWAGIRPLVRDPRAVGKDGRSTEDLVRSHFIFTSPSNLVTISGGKWTTYREMAEETIDEAIKVGGFSKAKPCVTRDLKLVGAENWNPNLPALLAQKFNVPSSMAEYLADNYGTRAPILCEMFNEDITNQIPVGLATNYKAISSPGTAEEIDIDLHLPGNIARRPLDLFRYPYTVGELRYCIKYEYARTALDFLMRRTRFAFLDGKEALDAVEGTVKVMGDELGWDDKRREYETKITKDFIRTFHV